MSSHAIDMLLFLKLSHGVEFPVGETSLFYIYSQIPQRHSKVGIYQWVGNLHFRRLDTLAHQSLKECSLHTTEPAFIIVLRI